MQNVTYTSSNAIWRWQNDINYTPYLLALAVADATDTDATDADADADINATDVAETLMFLILLRLHLQCDSPDMFVPCFARYWTVDMSLSVDWGLEHKIDTLAAGNRLKFSLNAS